MPSRRGTEKPQMSASRSPTTRPRRARATARLTVTDDFPTPPLPDDTARIRAVGGMSVARARSSWALRRARSIERAALGRVHLAHDDLDRGHPGEAPHPGFDVGAQLGAQGAAGDGQGHLDRDPAVGGHGHGPHHAEIDDVVAELGVDDARATRRAPTPRRGARKGRAPSRSYRSPGQKRSERHRRPGVGVCSQPASGTVSDDDACGREPSWVGPGAPTGGGSTVTTMSSVNIGKKPTVITLTDTAIAKVSDLLAQEGNDALALRVAVRPGGCSGYSYEMFFDSELVRRRRRRPRRARSRSWWTPPAPSC